MPGGPHPYFAAWEDAAAAAAEAFEIEHVGGAGEQAHHQALAVGEFISAAESYKRMLAVDRWVVRTVFDWIDEHRNRMDELHQFAVNLSGQTVGDPAFVEFVRDLLQRKHIEPSWISFEVTETAAIADLSQTVGIIADLKRLGNSIRIIVQTTEGDIFDQEFQETLQRINDEVFYIPGVDRAGLQDHLRPVPVDVEMEAGSGRDLASRDGHLAVRAADRRHHRSRHGAFVVHLDQRSRGIVFQ